MSEIKALGKLRTAARNMAKGRNLENHEECNLLLIIAGEIEAEIERDYMRPPVDADGALVKVGDTVYIVRDMPLVGLGKKDEYTVRGVGNDLAWIVKKDSNALDTCVYAHELRHVKPRTLEDVLWSFVDKWSSFAPEDFDGVQGNEVIDECADEIRAMCKAVRA